MADFFSHDVLAQRQRGVNVPEKPSNSFAAAVRTGTANAAPRTLPVQTAQTHQTMPSTERTRTAGESPTRLHAHPESRDDALRSGQNLAPSVRDDGLGDRIHPGAPGGNGIIDSSAHGLTAARILFLNIHGIESSFNELLYVLSKSDIKIIGLVETWCATAPDIPGYSSLVAPAHRGRRNRPFHRGAILYAKHDLKLEAISIRDDESSTIIAANTAVGDILLVYTHPHATHQPDVNSVLNPRRHLKLRTMILGDFNAFHPQINLNERTKKNKNGQHVVEIMEDQQLSVVSPEEPTFPQYGTRPDLVLLSNAHIHEVTTTFVCDDIASDHSSIIVEIETGRSQQVHTIKDWTNANWDLFKETLDRECDLMNLPPRPSRMQLDDLIQQWTTTVQNAVEKAVPEPASQALPEHKRRESQRRHQPAHETDPKRASSVQRETCQSGHPTAQQYEERRFQILDGNSETYTEEKDQMEVANAFAAYQKKICTAPSGGPNIEPTDATIDAHQRHLPEIYCPNWEPGSWETNDPITQPITFQELSTHLDATKNKAPGADGITKFIMAKMSVKCLDVLLYIMNECLETGYFPKPWKKGLLTMIPKPGKDPKLPESYRPISLLPVPGKLFERVVNHRVQRLVEESSLIGEEQMGFRPGRGTNLQLAALFDEINGAKLRKNRVTVLLFDVSKAFDKLWHEGLIYKLHRTGVFSNSSLRMEKRICDEAAVRFDIAETRSQTETLQDLHFADLNLWTTSIPSNDLKQGNYQPEKLRNEDVEKAPEDSNPISKRQTRTRVWVEAENQLMKGRVLLP
ncbi:hypothetical protein SNEBB_010485 [Seison nebaliae]|nr:hypothetical protein SNEBB_010485 [Seison nebaliae]